MILSPPLPPLTLVDIDVDIILVLDTIIILSPPLPPLIDVDIIIILVLPILILNNPLSPLGGDR
jgi:hypothetical protein